MERWLFSWYEDWIHHMFFKWSTFFKNSASLCLFGLLSIHCFSFLVALLYSDSTSMESFTCYMFIHFLFNEISWSQFRASDKGASERRSGFSRLLSNNGWQRHCEGWCHVNHVSHWNTHNRVLTICAFSGHQEPATGMWWLGMCILYVRTIACI